MTLIDSIFVITGILFHLTIAGIYVASKLGRSFLVRKLGYIVIGLAAPVIVTLIGYWMAGKPSPVLLYLAAILAYILLELILDFFLKVEFRKKPAIHIPYIVVFYGACFGFIGVAFTINSAAGYSVSVSFWITLACLIYLLRGGQKSAPLNGSSPRA